MGMDVTLLFRDIDSYIFGTVLLSAILYIHRITVKKMT